METDVGVRLHAFFSIFVKRNSISQQALLLRSLSVSSEMLQTFLCVKDWVIAVNHYRVTTISFGRSLKIIPAVETKAVYIKCVFGKKLITLK